MITNMLLLVLREHKKGARSFGLRKLGTTVWFLRRVRGQQHVIIMLLPFGHTHRGYAGEEKNDETYIGLCFAEHATVITNNKRAC